MRLINNIFLDMEENGPHVWTRTGPNSDDEDQAATLTKFDYDWHWELSSPRLYVKLPNGFDCTDLSCVRGYYDIDHPLNYAVNSEALLDPYLANPGALNFRATSASNFGQFGRKDDPAYSAFQSFFGRSIYHDNEGRPYTSTICSPGAFADPDF